MDDTTISTRHGPSTAARVFRLFLKRLGVRSTLLIVLLVSLVIGVALATIRNGVSPGSILDKALGRIRG